MFFWTNIFRKHGSQEAPQAKVPMPKASYIDPLILKFSLKPELLIGNFSRVVHFFVNHVLCFYSTENQL